MAKTVMMYATGGGRWKMIGAVTGTIYKFPERGAIPVDERDVEDLLSKKKGRGCCGHRSGERSYALFELA